jgi:Icc-related predicted phosphoesterase
MDPPALDHTFEALGVSINARGVVINEIGFFGVSASPFTPMNTPYEISEDEILHRAEAGWKAVQSARVKVFVPHAPPRHTTVDAIMRGQHVGSAAVRSFIEQHQPDVVVCGHIHEARGVDTIGKTQIVNCGPAGKGYYAVLDIAEHVRIELRG